MPCLIVLCSVMGLMVCQWWPLSYHVNWNFDCHANLCTFGICARIDVTTRGGMIVLGIGMRVGIGIVQEQGVT